MKGTVRWQNGHKRYELNGREVSAEEFYAAFPPQDASAQCLIRWKNLHSEALAVLPEQIKQAEQDAKDKKVPTQFDGHGRPIFTSRRHRRDYLRAYGVHDRNGGYGDG